MRNHDESWIFVILYLGMAVGLSVFVSLFWLVVVAFLHFVLEMLRQRHYRKGGRSVFLHALWEVKLDVGLVLLALMLVLYIEVVLGILGVQSAARAAAVSRAGARIGTRAAAWERNLRTFLLTFDEMIRIGHAGILMNRRRKRGKASAGAAVGAVGASAERSDMASSEAPGVAPSEAPPGEVPLAASGEVAESPPEAASGGPSGEARGAQSEDARGAASADAAAVATEVAAEVEAGDGDGDAEAPAPAVPADGADPGGAEAEDDTAPPVEAAPPPLAPAHTGPLPDAWSIRWKTSDRIGVALVVVGVIFIVTAPLFTPHDWATAAAALAEELRPFPGS
ncbi:MAG: hypothetical protein EA350_06610 [Gemmatimonadales bacterium]|nr:MAG: hypothetical protein EA350_06610 [Gemmatimonadales bacterium]